MVAPDLHAPPASPRAPRSWQKNRSVQKNLELCATVFATTKYLQQKT